MPTTPHRCDLVFGLFGGASYVESAVGILRSNLDKALLYANDEVVQYIELVRAEIIAREAKRKPEITEEPEIFLRLSALAQENISAHARLLQVTLLLVHLGCVSSDTVRGFGLPFLRLIHSCNQVFRLASGEWVPCHDLRIRTFNDLRLRIVEPYNNLFEDFIPRNLYPHFDPMNPSTNSERVETVEEALLLIRQYSRPLHTNLVNCISTIALTPPLHPLPRRSYSCRTQYLGGIFIDASSSDHVNVAMDIMHEYYHQQLWSLWSMHPDKAIPENCRDVCSPFTNRSISAPVMAQAYAIYSGALDFLRWLETSNEVGTTLQNISERISWIEHRLPILRARILESVGSSSALTTLFVACDEPGAKQMKHTSCL
jgi:hypothetical protein